MAEACSYGKVTRNMVENLTKRFEDLKTDMNRGFEEISKKQEELFNHMSSRLPTWATILFTIGGSLITGLAIWALTR